MNEGERPIITDGPDFRPAMALSALFSFLVLVFVVLDYAENPRAPGNSWSHEKGTSLFQVCVALALAASALTGALIRKKAVVCVHAALMSAVSIQWILSGIFTLNDKSIMGGRGPDANPVAGLSYAFALVAVILGALCGIFAVIVWFNLLRSPSRCAAQLDKMGKAPSPKP
jgi:hypothetical protein